MGDINEQNESNREVSQHHVILVMDDDNEEVDEELAVEHVE